MQVIVCNKKPHILKYYTMHQKQLVGVHSNKPETSLLGVTREDRGRITTVKALELRKN